MNFSFAVARLKDGLAAKRPNWGGYVKRTDVENGNGAYNLTFVKRGGTPYAFAVSAAGAVTTSASLALDASLMEGILADDWVIATAAQCEADRSGTGDW